MIQETGRGIRILPAIRHFLIFLAVKLAMVTSLFFALLKMLDDYSPS